MRRHNLKLLDRRHRGGNALAARCTGCRRLRLEPLEDRRLLSVFTVTNTLDSGAGSLRQAILDANAASDAAIIEFNIPVTDPGYEDVDLTLGGDAAPDVFVIRPLSALPALTGGNITIDGRTQTAFGGDTNPFGPEIVLNGSSVAGSANGLYVRSNHNQIYGLNIQQCTGNGIGFASAASDNVIQGNYIGTDATGTKPMGNGTYSGLYGIQIWAPGCQRNLIGSEDGDPALRNVISGNRGRGIAINTGASGSSGNIIAGNFIGTDATGTVGMGNGFGIGWGPGIQLADGGWTKVVGNTIADNNGPGIAIASNNNNLVAGNFIGTDSTGQLALGNRQQGILISGTAQSNQIGGSAALANTIAFNSYDGVSVVDTATGNAIRANSIYGNGRLGINLDGSGPTLNDPLDADAGPNNLQNFPALALAEPGTTTHVVGSLDSAADTTFTIDFYLNDAADPSGYGEGQQWLGAITVATDSSGHADFDHVFSAATSFGQFVTATATDPGGNTSEFSGAYVANAVQIDVKPGDSAASLNLASNGMIAVVLYSSFGFDAQSVDIGSVTFAGATVAMNSFEDVDGDGDLDAVFHFETQQTNLRALYVDLLLDDANADGVLDSTRQLAEVTLTGVTTDDLSFEGSDQLNLFLSGKKLRELLDQLYAQGLL